MVSRLWSVLLKTTSTSTSQLSEKRSNFQASSLCGVVWINNRNYILKDIKKELTNNVLKYLQYHRVGWGCSQYIAFDPSKWKSVLWLNLWLLLRHRKILPFIWILKCYAYLQDSKSNAIAQEVVVDSKPAHICMNTFSSCPALIIKMVKNASSPLGFLKVVAKFEIYKSF